MGAAASPLGQNGGPDVIIRDVGVGRNISQAPHRHPCDAEHPGQGQLVRHTSGILVPEKNAAAVLSGIEGRRIAGVVIVSHHRVGLEQALGNGILGGMVDGGGEEVPVLIHLKPAVPKEIWRAILLLSCTPVSASVMACRAR